MTECEEQRVAELTEKLTAYIQVLPDHYENTTYRLLQHVVEEEVIVDLSTDELMEIDDRFHEAVEDLGWILAPNKFNKLIMALNFNTPFILKHDPNEPDEEHDHEHEHGHDHHHHH